MSTTELTLDDAVTLLASRHVYNNMIKRAEPGVLDNLMNSDSTGWQSARYGLIGAAGGGILGLIREAMSKKKRKNYIRSMLRDALLIGGGAAAIPAIRSGFSSAFGSSGGENSPGAVAAKAEKRIKDGGPEATKELMKQKRYTEAAINAAGGAVEASKKQFGNTTSLAGAVAGGVAGHKLTPKKGPLTSRAGAIRKHMTRGQLEDVGVKPHVAEVLQGDGVRSTITGGAKVKNKNLPQIQAPNSTWGKEKTIPNPKSKGWKRISRSQVSNAYRGLKPGKWSKRLSVGGGAVASGLLSSLFNDSVPNYSLVDP